MRVFASLKNDINEGHVWLLKEGLLPRSVVKVINTKNGKAIYCEALQIDNNFLREYNKQPRFIIDDPVNSIVMNSWFRAKLDIFNTQENYDISVVATNSCKFKIRAGIDHPQLVVRVAVWLGIVGAVSGVIGVLLGMYSLKQSWK
ncbi:hypothetical protein [Geomonas agri]|uniref:hypothetical protein n=1 Tax=Geomonas agri TaxID=2873702 RepID=UPI001CD28158|nr:hypothetical protein [Geomonas agri]